MSLSAQNHIVERFHQNDPILPLTNEPSIEGIRYSRGDFVCGFTEKGAVCYAFETLTAVVLLAPVRNLKWIYSSGEEATASCPAGTAFIVPAATRFTLVWPESIEHLIVSLDRTVTLSDTEGGLDEARPSSGTIIRFSSKQCLQVAQIIWEEVTEPFHDHNDYLDALYGVLSNLLMRNAHAAENSGGEQSGLSNYACRQIEIYLKENFRNPVSVPDMAALLGISAGHFATCFRTSFGRTPHQYLMKLRLDEAERCLRETDMPIGEIATRLSFSSQSHLTTALKKYRHLTPGEVRRRGIRQGVERLR